MEVCRLGIKLKDLSVESGHRNHQISKKKVNYLEFFPQYFIEEYFLDLQFQLANQGINLPSLLLPAASEETGTDGNCHFAAT